jgi:hypothetical protein
MELKLEVVPLPVSDVDQALAFLSRMGWRLDVDLAPNDKLPPSHVPRAISLSSAVRATLAGSRRHCALVVTKRARETRQ